MNKKFCSSGNIPAASIIILLVLVILSLWYFLHPSSPYHRKDSYIIHFTKIGTLSTGSTVCINGLSKGKVSKIKITEDDLFITIDLLAQVHIPRNSSIRLVSAGFLGERQVAILLGDSQKFFSPGDTLEGIYDTGVGGISENLKVCMGTLRTMSATVKLLSDSLLENETGESLKHVQSKWKRLLLRSRSLATEWKTEAGDLLDRMDSIADKSSGLIQEARGNLQITQGRADTLLLRIDTLKSSLQHLHAEVQTVESRLENQDNSAALILTHESALFSEIEALGEHTKNLVSEVKKSGLHINVDIF